MRPAMDETLNDNLTDAARDKLRLTVERIERKALGYDTKALRSVIRLRKQDRQERAEQEAILEVYLDALGELD